MFLTICKLRRATKAKKYTYTQRQELRFNFPSWFGLQLNIKPFFLLLFSLGYFRYFYYLNGQFILFLLFVSYFFASTRSFVRSCTICNWMLCRISIIHSFSAIFSVCVRIVKLWNGVYFCCILLQILHIFFLARERALK